MSLVRSPTTWPPLVQLLLLTAIVGCGPRSSPPATTQAKGPPPSAPPTVLITQPRRDTIVDYRVYTGRTSAVNEVDVRARVNGYLLQTPQRQWSNATSQDESEIESDSTDDFRVHAHEGERVTEGEPLFEIDPAPYRLAYEEAVSNREVAEAQLKRYALDLQRAEGLVRDNSISQAEFDLAVANQSAGAAQVESLNAAVARAKLDLEYTHVTAPISGLLGRTLVTRGNLVSADSTILTRIVSWDPIYVDFNVDENSLLDYRARMRSGTVSGAKEIQIEVQMGLANESEFTHVGIIDFVDNETSPSTGNTRVRARFSNTDQALSPGLFARVRTPFTAPYEGLLVPTRALAMDQQGRYVLVVDEEQKVRRQQIEIGTQHGDETVILKGVREADRVIISGLQKAMPGSLVTARLQNEADDGDRR